MNMNNSIDRRRHRRVQVNYWASLKHPLLGTVTAEVSDMSISGVLLKLDEDVDVYVMMELDIRIHGKDFEKEMPSLPVQVVRVSGREVALRFQDTCQDIWAPPDEDDDVFESSGLGEGLGDIDPLQERITH